MKRFPYTDAQLFAEYILKLNNKARKRKIGVVCHLLCKQRKEIHVFNYYKNIELHIY